jgi:hypothetical protein
MPNSPRRSATLPLALARPLDTGGGTVYYASSTYIAHGGPGGPTYTRSTSSRYGPGGVAEHQEAVRNPSEERMTIQRSLGGKGRTMTRSRSRRGEEQAHEELHNMSQEEAVSFDDEWRTHASRHLPSFNLLESRLNSAPVSGSASIPEARRLRHTGSSGSRGSRTRRGTYV